jgi:hypothetical protein
VSVPLRCPECGEALRVSVQATIVDEETRPDGTRIVRGIEPDPGPPKYLCPNGHDVDLLRIQT